MKGYENDFGQLDPSTSLLCITVEMYEDRIIVSETTPYSLRQLLNIVKV